MHRVTIDRAHEECVICQHLSQVLYSELVHFGIAGPRTTGLVDGDTYHRVTVRRNLIAD